MNGSIYGWCSKPSKLLARIFWNVLLLLLTILTWITGFYGFSRVTPFGVCGGPEKDRDVCFCGAAFTRALPGFALPGRDLLA